MTSGTTTRDMKVVVLPERIDSANAASVEATLMGALRPGSPLIVDGSAVAYMSAAGVRLLAKVLHRAHEVQAHIVFCRFTGAAAECLEVSGFGQLLEVVDSIEQATARLSDPGYAAAPRHLHPRHRAG